MEATLVRVNSRARRKGTTGPDHPDDDHNHRENKPRHFQRNNIQTPVTMNTRQITVMPKSVPGGTLFSFRVLRYLIQRVARTKTPTPMENQGFIDAPLAALETGPCRIAVMGDACVKLDRRELIRVRGTVRDTRRLSKRLWTPMPRQTHFLFFALSTLRRIGWLGSDQGLDSRTSLMTAKYVAFAERTA